METTVLTWAEVESFSFGLQILENAIFYVTDKFLFIL